MKRILVWAAQSAFTARSPASTSPTWVLAIGQIRSQVGVYGEKQTPVQARSVKALRNTRLVEEIAYGRKSSA
jgi:hypothetical protein